MKKKSVRKSNKQIKKVRRIQLLVVTARNEIRTMTKKLDTPKTKLALLCDILNLSIIIW